MKYFFWIYYGQVPNVVGIFSMLLEAPNFDLRN